MRNLVGVAPLVWIEGVASRNLANTRQDLVSTGKPWAQLKPCNLILCIEIEELKKLKSEAILALEKIFVGRDGDWCRRSRAYLFEDDESEDESDDGDELDVESLPQLENTVSYHSNT